MSLVAYDNRALGTGVFTAVTGSWASSPEISNMGSMQVPVPYAQVTPSGGSIEFDFQAQDSSGSAESFTARVLGLLAHTLPDSAVVAFYDGSTELAQVTWSADEQRPNNLYAVLSSNVSLDTLTVTVTSAGSDAVRIGGLWVSPAFVPSLGFGMSSTSLKNDSLSILTYATATPWANEKASREVSSFTIPGMSETEALGPAMPNWRGLTRLQGKHSPVIAIPDESNLEYSVYGLLTRTEPMVPTTRQLWNGGFEVTEIA